MNKGTRSYCFVFICQQGDLEIKSLLLAASLKRFLRCSYELVAAVPTPREKWGSPHISTLKQLEEMGARVVHVVNDIHPDYPIGNKVSCLCIPTQADKTVFMDSDMLCLKTFSGDLRFALPFNAKPADLATYAADEEMWRRIYAAGETAMPSLRIPTTVSGDYTPPYFNAGFIAVQTGIPLGDTWLACCRKIDADAAIPDKRPWLDQIALPVALQQLGLPFDCLDESYNHPAHLKPLDPRRIPFFCHYHRPEVIRREPLMNRLVRDLSDQYPVIREAILSHGEWKSLLSPYAGVRPASWWKGIGKRKNDRKDDARELIITGIPRSGTSYLCSLLHQMENCVVINEPAEIFAPLIHQRIPWGVATYYRDLRRDILDGKPIKNKVTGQHLIEDTAIKDEIREYSPRVSASNFVLGTKNTLAYLARQDALRRAMPEARLVVCVRNPFDTIASWKGSFPHLREADIASFPVGHPNDPMLSEHQRKTALYISGLKDIAERRAVLWRYLAETILDNLKTIHLVYYEDLVANPSAVMKSILQGMASTAALLKKPVNGKRGQRRSGKRGLLDSWDEQVIRAICMQSAAELGINK